MSAWWRETSLTPAACGEQRTSTALIVYPRTNCKVKRTGVQWQVLERTVANAIYVYGGLIESKYSFNGNGRKRKIVLT